MKTLSNQQWFLSSDYHGSEGSVVVAQELYFRAMDFGSQSIVKPPNMSYDQLQNTSYYGRTERFALVQTDIDRLYGVPYHVEEPLIGVIESWAVGASGTFYTPKTYAIAIPSAIEVLRYGDTLASYYLDDDGTNEQ